jgi:hypothetical protein
MAKKFRSDGGRKLRSTPFGYWKEVESKLLRMVALFKEGELPEIELFITGGDGISSDPGQEGYTVAANCEPQENGTTIQINVWNAMFYLDEYYNKMEDIMLHELVHCHIHHMDMTDDGGVHGPLFDSIFEAKKKTIQNS